MHVNKTGRYDQPGDIDDLFALEGLIGYGRNLASPYADVTDFVEIGFRVDNPAVF
jgi:hypothetical protein